MSKKKEGPGDLWKRIRKFLEPETPQGVAALLGASVTPGVGFGVDVADAIAGIQDKDALRTGIASLGAALPFVSGASIRQLLKQLGRLEDIKDVRKVEDLFQKEAIERAVAKRTREGPNWSSLVDEMEDASVTIGMHPEEYLAYVGRMDYHKPWTPPGFTEPTQFSEVSLGQFENLLDMLRRNERADEVPQLFLKHRKRNVTGAPEGFFDVLGHEGRHRSALAAASGIETIPVQTFFFHDVPSLAGRHGEMRRLPMGIETLLDPKTLYPSRLTQEDWRDVFDIPTSLSRRNIKSLVEEGMPRRISPTLTVDEIVRAEPTLEPRHIKMSVGIDPRSIERQIKRGPLPRVADVYRGPSEREILIDAFPSSLEPSAWNLGIESWFSNINKMKKGDVRELLSQLAKILKDVDADRRFITGRRITGAGPSKRKAVVDLSKVRPPRPYRVGGAVNKEET